MRLSLVITLREFPAISWLLKASISSFVLDLRKRMVSN